MQLFTWEIFYESEIFFEVRICSFHQAGPFKWKSFSFVSTCKTKTKSKHIKFHWWYFLFKKKKGLVIADLQKLIVQNAILQLTARGNSVIVWCTTSLTVSTWTWGRHNWKGVWGAEGVGWVGKDHHNDKYCYMLT